MAVKKKPSRKELLKEPDEFLSFSRKMLLFAVSHKKQLIIAASVFFGLLAAIAGYRFYEFRSEDRAFTLLKEATAAYEAAAGDADARAARLAAAPAFEKLFDRYPDKAAARIGQVLYADICFAAGDPQQAAELYTLALEAFQGDPALQSLIRSSLGYAREAEGDLEKAADSFRQVADGPDSIFKDDALFQLARIHERMGRTSEGAQLYEKITESHPSSLFSEIAREKAVLGGGS